MIGFSRREPGHSITHSVHNGCMAVDSRTDTAPVSREYSHLRDEISKATEVDNAAQLTVMLVSDMV